MINAGTAVLASSKVTTAVLSAYETATSATPGTAWRADFTVIGQAEQYMFRTARVTVCTPASAADETSRLNPNNAIETSLVTRCSPIVAYRKSGARKSNAKALATRTEASKSPVITTRFGSCREQTSPSAQAICLDR